MSRMRALLLLPVLFCGLLAGCGTAASVAAVTPVAQVSPAPAPGSVAITGDVREPRVLTPADLARLPRTTVPVTFRSGEGRQARVFSGVLLADILPTSALAPAPGRNAFLRFAVLATAPDGYAALVSYGELAPDFGNKRIMLATTENGRKLDRPRLVVPGDVRGGRYVTDVVELRVVAVTP